MELEDVSILPAVDKFIRRRGREDDVVLKRRELLTRMLVVSGVAAAAPIIESASAIASPLEGEASFDYGLGDAHRRVYDIGRKHMQPGADFTELMSEAVAAWRDAHVARLKAPTRAGRRAANTEAFAAGLVAQFLGDQGETRNANTWYGRAEAIAPDSNVLAWLAACKVWMPLYEGDSVTAVRYGRIATRRIGFREGERGAFAWSQLARAQAMQGDVSAAKASFDKAEEYFDSWECDTHRKTEPNLLHFTQYQFAQYAAEIMGTVGKFERARKYRALALQAPNLNGMNRAVLEMGEAHILVAENQADGAVRHATRVLESLPEADLHTAVVGGRARRLAMNLGLTFGDIKPVIEFRQFTQEFTKAA